MKPLFVTGIGTEVGKTVASAVLVEALGADYWKPVQAGDLDNSDTLKVERWTSNAGKMHQEGFRLNTPMSPHEAANRDGVEVKLADFSLPQTDNKLLVEGAGGLLVPINDTETIADLIPLLNAEVVLVIRHYLGSINHSLLSIQYLQQKGYPVKGLIFNGKSVPSSEQIILKHSPWPLLGRIDEAKEIDASFVAEQAKRFTHL